jgi:hypothetical protein
VLIFVLLLKDEFLEGPDLSSFNSVFPGFIAHSRPTIETWYFKK